jgi:hypothetical protein
VYVCDMQNGKNNTTNQIIAELNRLYTLAWIADSKVEYETSTGRALNPQQKAASSRIMRKINKLWNANQDVITYGQLLEISNETYTRFQNAN